jgi:hypothetical protein
VCSGPRELDVEVINIIFNNVDFVGSKRRPKKRLNMKSMSLHIYPHAVFTGMRINELQSKFKFVLYFRVQKAVELILC